MGSLRREIPQLFYFGGSSGGSLENNPVPPLSSVRPAATVGSMSDFFVFLGEALPGWVLPELGMAFTSLVLMKRLLECYLQAWGIFWFQIFLFFSHCSLEVPFPQPSHTPKKGVPSLSHPNNTKGHRCSYC